MTQASRDVAASRERWPSHDHFPKLDPHPESLPKRSHQEDVVPDESKPARAAKR